MNAPTPPLSAPTADHVDALPMGTRLGEFEIQALLGVGGFGMVYRAFDHSLLRPVAIKEYMPAALAARAASMALQVRTSCDTDTYQSGLASFMEEARLLAQFDHPSLVKVFRFWQANNTAYMVMPLYQGMTLKQARLHMRKPPPEAWLRKVLWAVLDALRVLHNSHTLHRDISPDNIFLQDIGPPVLLDLGAARHAIGDPQDEHTAILKVNYAPIEQYDRKTTGQTDLVQGPWSDLYSLAAVVHGCVCNDAPLPATLRAIRDRMVRFSRVTKTVRAQFGVEYSPPFVAAISQSLQVEPDKRPQSIDAFLALMDMSVPPPGMRGFNWRADLGSSWEEAPESTAFGAGADTEMATRFMGHPNDAGDAGGLDLNLGVEASSPDAPDSVFVPEPLPPRPSPLGSTGQTQRHKAGQAPAKRSPALALGALALLLAAGVGWWQWGSEPAAPPAALPAPISTAAPAAPAAPTPPTVTDAASLDAKTETLIDAQTPPEPTPAAAPPEAAAQHPARPKATRAKAVEAPPTPAPAAPAPEPTPTPAPPAPAPRPEPARSPESACADASFIARPMCIHNECQKAEFAKHPVCVQAKRAREEEEQRRRMLGQ